MKDERLHTGPQLGADLGQCRRARYAGAHCQQDGRYRLQLPPQGNRFNLNANHQSYIGWAGLKPDRRASRTAGNWVTAAL